jgi:hypothetical protein
MTLIKNVNSIVKPRFEKYNYACPCNWFYQLFIDDLAGQYMSLLP